MRPRYPTIHLDTWEPNGPEPLRGVRIRAGNESIFITGKHVAGIAASLTALAAALRQEDDPNGGHRKPAEWRYLARTRANRITALEAQLADLSGNPETSPADRPGTTERNPR